MDNKLGNYIKELRVKHNYTTEQLSEISGICENYIIRIEKGLRKNPSTSVLEMLADAFNIKVYELTSRVVKETKNRYRL